MSLQRSCLGLAAAILISVPAAAQLTLRGSVASTGAEANAGSFYPSASSGGQFLSFTSLATNLVPGDTNGVEDVFVRDFATGITERVSIDSAGNETDDDSISPSVSGDGRFVVFSSLATNLVGGDTNGVSDVFLRDRVAGTTQRVSVSSAGAQANGESTLPAISTDGQFVAFRSAATNLVSGDANGKLDIFVRDLSSGVTSRVSVDSSGVEGNAGSSLPALSAHGRYIAFQSTASNLVAGDTNAKNDVFVRDTQSGTTELVSVDSSGLQGNLGSGRPAISGDGLRVAFESSATNLVPGDTNAADDVFVHDRASGATERVSVTSAGAQGNGASLDPALSYDGRYAAFWSAASNLVMLDSNGSGDIFVRDRQLSLTERASVDSNGVESGLGFGSDSPSISFDGRYVSFFSVAQNFAPGDANLAGDVFAHVRSGCTRTITNYCTAKVNSASCMPNIAWSGTPSASAGSGFSIDGEQVLAGKAGLLFYSVVGPDASAFQGGLLCAATPTKRTSLQTSSAAGVPPCTGRYSFDFNVRIASGADPELVPGRTVWCQYWTRDSGALSGTGLTDGLTFTICQ